MATTIQSGRGNSPLLTADVASRAEVYGGRGLVFDGVADGLEISGDIPQILVDANAFSVTTWIKPTDVSANGNTIITGHNRNTFSIQRHGNGLLIYVANTILLNQGGLNKFANNKWSHLAVTYDEVNLKYYIDGELIGTVANTTNINRVTDKLYIGCQNLTSAYFDGSISDLKVYSSVLSESDIQSQYKKPESVPSPSTLVAWYPMSEGNPDSPQSIVYDHSEKKLSTEIAQDNTFSNTTNSQFWNGQSSISNNKLHILGSNHGGSQSGNCFIDQSSSNNAQISSDPIVSGKLYKVTGTVTVNSVESSQYIRDGGFGNYTMWISNSDFSIGTHSFEVYIIGADSHINIQIPNCGADTNITIDALSVKEMLMGNHATTNFFGDDLQTGTWNNSDLVGFTGASADGFTAVNTDASAGDNDNAYGDEISFVANKTYQLSFTNTINSGTMPSLFVGVTSGTDGSADNIMSYATFSSANNYSYTFTPSSTVTRRPSFRFTGNGAYNFTISNFAVKEVGISSSGFETAVNEPVVPQVPLMKYNQKMLFDGVSDQHIALGSQSMGGNEQTISAWIVINGFVDTTPTVITFGKTMLQMNSGTITYYSNVQTGTTLSVSKALTVKKLYHIAITKDSSGNGKLYLNGVLEETDTSLANINNDSATSYIGRYGSDYFDGTIDDVSIFNTAFNATQVQELFNDGVALDATTHSKSGNLLGYWRNDGVATWKDRKGWSYLDFVTTDNDYLQSASASTAFGTNPFSFSVWINHHSTIQQAIFSSAQWNNNQDWFFASIKSGSSGLLGLGTYSEWKHKFDTALVQTNKWHLVTYVREGTGTNQSKWYLDGALVNTATDATDWKFGNNLHIGSYVTSGGFIDGQISQLAIYHNKVLSEPEVLEQFNNGISSKFTTSGMTHHYVMNDGTTIVDLVGGNNATNNGATYVSGDGNVQGSPDAITIREGLNSNKDGLGFPFKNADSNVLRLNGIDEYLLVDKTGSFPSGDQSRSVTCWIKPHSFPSGNDQPIVFMGTYDGNQMFTVSFLYNSTNRISVWGYNNDYTGSDVLTIDNWWYVGVTYDSGTNTLKSYIGGGADNINPALDINNTSVTDFNTTYGDIKIGRAQNKYFDGMIDEVKIYNRALSADEILKDFKHQKGKHKND